MSFVSSGLWLSFLFIALLGLFFFLNTQPKHIVPRTMFLSPFFWIYKVLLGVLLLCLILLPLRISFVDEAYVIQEKNIPIQIVFDVSLSMAATDFSPSRFVAAKSSLISLVESLDGYYVSLITFSGKPFVYIPFSSDVSSVIAKLDTMNLGDFPPVEGFLGTAVGDALLLALVNLEPFVSADYDSGIVVLLTDGDSNVGHNPLDVVQYYQHMGIPLFVLGVGNSYYSIGVDTWNSTIMTDINFSLLYELARVTGGKFYAIGNNQSLIDSFDVLLTNIVNKEKESVLYTYWEITPYLLYLIFVVLVLLVLWRLYLFFSIVTKK